MINVPEPADITTVEAVQLTIVLTLSPALMSLAPAEPAFTDSGAWCERRR